MFITLAMTKIVRWRLADKDATHSTLLQFESTATVVINNQTRTQIHCNGPGFTEFGICHRFFIKKWNNCCTWKLEDKVIIWFLRVCTQKWQMGSKDWPPAVLELWPSDRPPSCARKKCKRPLLVNLVRTSCCESLYQNNPIFQPVLLQFMHPFCLVYFPTDTLKSKQSPSSYLSDLHICAWLEQDSGRCKVSS